MDFDLTPQNDVFTIGATVPNSASVRGLGGSDRIFGAARPDVIYGNSGGDYILGNAGNDVIYGGRDSDFLAGGQGADQILGQRGNDVLLGGAGNDRLQGDEGDDFISGDLGIDTLTGGDGADAFALSTLQTATDIASADLITDFDAEAGDLFALTDGGNDNLSEADVKLEASGSDTVIRLASTGAILARVQGVAPAALAGTFSTKKSTIDDVEPGANNLGNLGAATPINNFVGDEDYNDYFRFTVTNPSVLEVNLTGLAGDSDVDLELYRDADGDGELGTDEIVASSAQSGNAAESISNMLLQSGDYFLAVTQFEGNSNYTLSVAGTAGTPRDLAGDSAATARVLPTDGDTALNDFVGGSDASDTYRLKVDVGYLDINTSNRTGDVNLQLWRDRNGNGQLDPSESVAEGQNDIALDGGLTPGDYYLNVKAASAATSYQITALNERGNRAAAERFKPLLTGIVNKGTLDQNDQPDPADPDNYADVYQLPELASGLTVELTHASSNFDAYLTVVDVLTGEVVAENDDIDTEGGNYDSRVTFTTDATRQYLVYASSVDAPGLGEYNITASITGTPTTTIPRVNRDDAELPPAVYTGKGDSARGEAASKTTQLIYVPLTGGLVEAPYRINGINQQNLGDCATLAAMTATFGKIDNPAAAATAISSILNSNLQVTGDNNYSFTTYDYTTGQAKVQSVNNQVIASPDSQELYANSPASGVTTPDQANGVAIWGSVAERAYAKQRGIDENRDGYTVMGNGDLVSTTLRRITGKAVEYTGLDASSTSNQTSFQPVLSLENDAPATAAPITKAEVFQRIQTAFAEGRYVIAGSPTDAEQRSDGVIVGGHAFSVHNAYIDPNTQKQMIMVRNPWGKDNTKDVVGSDDPYKDANDAFITLTFDNFLKYFDEVAMTLG
jgi:hypothetical protein